MSKLNWKLTNLAISCGNQVGDCSGHFGIVELARPVIHVGYANIVVYRLLKTTCRSCNRILLDQKVIDDYLSEIEECVNQGKNIPPNIVRSAIKEARKKKKCPHCGAEQYKIKFEKPTTFIEETEAGVERLTPAEIQKRFENIISEDLPLVGLNNQFSRPEWTILNVLPVPPVSVRASITLESGVRSEDDLTHKLVDIIRINQRLKENIEAGAPHLIVEDLWELLQYHVTTYMDNEVAGIPPARHRSGRALRTLSQRLRGKEGRFRGNLSGKRVDFSARTVISPDPLISINDVGVPEAIAKILTVPERVTEWNIEEMKELVINGPVGHPGANYIIRPDGKRVDLRFVSDLSNTAEVIDQGFIVERHIRDGDIVLFNRQPSLHRMSIMAHEVRVVPYRTFRLHLCVCLSGDTEVLTDLGKTKISELTENYKDYAPLSCNWNHEKTVYYSGIEKTHKIVPQDLGVKSYRIQTSNGRSIEATEDHPFYTKHGIVKTGELKIGDSLVVYPIDFPKVGGCGTTLLTQEQAIAAMPDTTYKEYTLKELEEMNLLNIPPGSKAQIDLASLVGHLFGDGSLLISYEGGRVIFRAADKSDIESLWNIVTSFNIKPTSIEESESRGDEILTADGKVLEPKGKVYFFEVRRKPVAIAFKALGVPVGDRVSQSYRIPEWIRKGSAMVKRAFLRSYFGAEMSSPKVEPRSPKRFRQPIFKFAKIKEIDATPLISDFKTLLEDFGVEVATVSTEKGNIQKRDGKETINHVLTLSASDENLLRLFKYIGFDFARKKEVFARHGTGYLTLKVNKKADLSHNFPTFEEWRKIVSEKLNNGFIWDKISSIDEIELSYAFDITTTDKNHNFIARGFLSSNCTPYNADFDGDEMNLHVPQSEEARAETRVLMRVQEQILSPRYGGPIIGAIHDYVSAAFLLTRKRSFFTREEALQLLMAGYYTKNLPLPAIEHPKRLWSGKQIFALLLPEGLTHTAKSSTCEKCKEGDKPICYREGCRYDAYVVIKDGELLSGVMDRRAIGADESESVLHLVVKEWGSDYARIFIDSLTQMLIEFMTHIGFSIGFSNINIPSEGKRAIISTTEKVENKIRELIDSYEKGQLKATHGKTLRETLEMRIMQELSKARNETGEIAGRYMGLSNTALVMVKTGAKGNNLNIAQMSACIGQQSIRGERILRGYRDRALPHFRRGDIGAFERGFVRSNYREGLDPIEFFFHAQGGREGLVDTAVRTSTSGYLQRRLVNALQDLRVDYDNAVRTADSEVIQLRYGEDGVDPTKSFHGRPIDIQAIINQVVYSQREIEQE